MHNIKKTIYSLCFVFIGFFYAIPITHALEIQSIRFGEQPSALRIVLDLDQPVDFRAMLASTPNRVMLDIPRLSTSALTTKRDLPPLISDIRLEPFAADYTRITFILKSPATIRTAFAMPAQGGKPNRLVLDLSPATPEAFTKGISRVHGNLQVEKTIAKPSIDRPTAPALPFAKGTAGIRLSPELDETPDIIDTTLPLIILDAGHGGHDSGAVGHKVLEKNITLSVVKAVKAALESTGQYRVALTRDNDTFISLVGRVKKARALGADLFVSIHADSVEHGGDYVQGASFYTLSEQATDARAAALAARENKSETLSGVNLPTDDFDVKTILIDLAMRETTSGSNNFARELVKSFRAASIKTVPSPIRSAGFMVLQAPDIPSVLIELGFLSNPTEAAKLNDPEYRDHLAKAITKGITSYFTE